MKKNLFILLFIAFALRANATTRSVPTVSLSSSRAYNRGALFIARPTANDIHNTCEPTVLVPVFIDNEYDSALTNFSIPIAYDTTHFKPLSVEIYNDVYVHPIAWAKDFAPVFSTLPYIGTRKQVIVTGSVALRKDSLRRTVYYNQSNQRDPSTSVALDTSVALFWIRFALLTPFTPPVTAAVNRDTLNILPDVEWDGGMIGTRGSNSPAGIGGLYVQRTALPLLAVEGADVTKSDSAHYALTKDIDSGSVEPGAVMVVLRVRNATANSVLNPVHIVSSQDWLLVGLDTVPGTPFAPSREIVLPQIVASSVGNDTVRVRMIVKTAGLSASEYSANLTYSAAPFCMSAEPVTLAVTLSLKRFAREGQRVPCASNGMNIFIHTSGSDPQYDTLAFGTGLGATRGQDKLFAEKEEPTPALGFSPRWFPVTLVDDGSGQRGFRGTKRDIREVDPTDTLWYLCRMGVVRDSQYPVVISWQSCSFPKGAAMIIEDTVGGRYFRANIFESDTIISIDSIRHFTSFVIGYLPLRNGPKKTIVKKAWNLLSSTIYHTNTSATALYPNAIGKALNYRSGKYEQDSLLLFGRGYFLRYGSIISSGESEEVDGLWKTEITEDDNVRLWRGWNMIGALSVPVDVSNIVLARNDTARLVSECFEFSPLSGFRARSTLEPGKGYFVKISGDAFYTVKATHMMMMSHEVEQENLPGLTVRDAEGKSSSLLLLREGAQSYELPPQFPETFDVRFTDGTYASDASSPEFRVSTARFPLTLDLENPTGISYELWDEQELLGTFDESHSSLVVTEDHGDVLTLRRKTDIARFALSIVTPNPAGDHIMIFVDAPESMTAMFTLSDALGRTVRSRSESLPGAHTHAVRFDVRDLPPGAYFLRMDAEGFRETRRFIVAQ